MASGFGLALKTDAHAKSASESPLNRSYGSVMAGLAEGHHERSNLGGIRFRFSSCMTWLHPNPDARRHCWMDPALTTAAIGAVLR